MKTFMMLYFSIRFRDGLLLCTLLLISAIAVAQSPNENSSRYLDKLKARWSETSLPLVPCEPLDSLTLQGIPEDLRAWGSMQTFGSVYVDDEFEIIQMGGYGEFVGFGFSGRPFVKVYKEKGEVVYIQRSYTEASRMGSCGHQQIVETYYFKNGKCVNSEYKEGNGWGCYMFGTNPEKATELAEFLNQRADHLAFDLFSRQLYAETEEQTKKDTVAIDHSGIPYLEKIPIVEDPSAYRLKYVSEFWGMASRVKPSDQVTFESFNQGRTNNALPFFSGVSYVSDRFVVFQVSGPIDTAIPHDTTYYFEREEQ